MNAGVGNRRIEVTEENQLYSSSTVYFRQEAVAGHNSRRAVSLGPTLSLDDGSSTGSTDFDIDHEDGGIPHVRRTRNAIGGRRGASVDLTNFHRDVVSHHATTRIPTPAYHPTAEDTPEGSPTSSATNLPVAQPDQGSYPPPQPRPSTSSHVHSNSFSAQRDPRRLTVSGTSNDFDPCPPLSRRRASQALEDFWRALKPDLNSTPSPRSTPPRIDASTLTPPILSPSLSTSLTNTPSRLSPSRSPDGFDDDTQGRRKSRNRFSFFALSDAIRDSVRPGSSLGVRKKVEGTPVRSDSRDNDKNGESARGRPREKGKGKSRDLSTALIKVSEVFGLEPEEGRESRDGWQEFKKGAFHIVLVHPVPHSRTVL